MKVRPVALDDTPRESEPVARQKVERDKENFIRWKGRRTILFGGTRPG